MIFSTWDEIHHSRENLCLIFVYMVYPGSQRPEEGYSPELVELRTIPTTQVISSICLVKKLIFFLKINFIAPKAYVFFNHAPFFGCKP